MSNPETIKLPDGLVNKLEHQVQKHKKDEEKPSGYSEVVRILGLKEITFGQAKKIKSFYDNYAPSDSEQKEKFEMYSGNAMRSFVNNHLQSIATAKKNSNSIRRQLDIRTKNNNQTGREVDRLSKTSLASVKPSNVTGKKITNQLMVGEEIRRIKQLMVLLG